jgi:hypothetical protein
VRTERLAKSLSIVQGKVNWSIGNEMAVVAIHLFCFYAGTWGCLVGELMLAVDEEGDFAVGKSSRGDVEASGVRPTGGLLWYQRGRRRRTRC